ncbi:MAG: glycoside hydrolase family 43 protein [Bacteroidota bacterium]|nr:glycoside hydrolase family 43 protein [Bacteroidota bacterium]
MNRYHQFFVLGLLLFLFPVFSSSCEKDDPGTTKAATTDTTTVKTSLLKMADPTIFCYKDTFYLYGTSSDEGIQVYKSADLKTWEGPCGATDGFALKKGDSYGTAGFWAPQVFEYHGKLFMAYAADEHIAIASSDSPVGPFKQKTLQCISGTTKQIDPYVFFDENGKAYLYYVRLLDGNNIYVSPMKEDLSDIKADSVTLCIKASNAWENTENAPWPVTEGPSVLKYNNLYYLFYSANDYRNIDYAVGYATSTFPCGPWEKTADSPIISRNNVGRNGTGHGDFFTGKNNQLYYVFHLHYSNTEVQPRVTGLVQCSFMKNAQGVYQMKPAMNTFKYLKYIVKD